MRKVVLLIGMWLLVLTTMAVSSRTVLPIGDNTWKIIERSDAGNNFDASEENLSLLKAEDSLTTSMSLIAEVNITENDYNIVVLNLFGGSSYYDVYVNGIQLSNELGNENFHADLTSFVEDGKIVLMLNPRINQTVTKFEQIISKANLIFMSGVVLCHIDVKTDPFFGDKLIDVNINNFLDTDIDGKIYARLYNAESWDLITESNNCAYARAGLDGTIEINFPDFDSKYKGSLLFAEVIMVDKENNEELIDQLTFPVRF